MNTFLNALQNETNFAETDNGGLTHYSSLNNNLDFFYVGPVAKKNPKDAVVSFQRAYAEDREISLRVLQWVRDVRGGAGARQAFRDCFAYLMDRAPNDAIAVLNNVATIGRWDDVLVGLFSEHSDVQQHAISLIRKALIVDQDGLCAKWMPRKGIISVALRAQLGLSPKGYRKLLVSLSNTVEQQMCANNWDDVNYSHVPSVAFARYRDAFKRHDEVRYADFVAAADRGEVKVNAGAIFPHDVVGTLLRRASVDLTTRHSISAQWKALPDYLEGDDTGIVVADVSGSMATVVAGGTTALDVSIALAMYMAERARGPFKDTFITFSNNPSLQTLKGDIVDRYQQLKKAEWNMSTNIEGVFKLVLNTAVKNKITQDDMPKFITIVSDMEFNECTNGTTLDTIRSKYEEAGYTIPKLVFWNVSGRAGNVPAKADDKNVALVSGYSPAVVSKVFSAETITPMQVMLDTIGIERYDLKLD